MTTEEISARQTLLLAAWRKGRNWSRYCFVDSINTHFRSALEGIAILSRIGMHFGPTPVFQLQMLKSVYIPKPFHSSAQHISLIAQPASLVTKITLQCGHQLSSQRLQMTEDLRMPTATGQWWPYLLDAKSDANLSLLLGIVVAYIWFQLVTNNPQTSSHWSPFSLSLPINEDPLHWHISWSFPCSLFVLHWSELPHFLPLLGYDYDSCKVTAVLSGFCSKSKERIQRWYCCSVFHSVKSYGCIPCSGNSTVR